MLQASRTACDLDKAMQRRGRYEKPSLDEDEHQPHPEPNVVQIPCRTCKADQCWKMCLVHLPAEVNRNALLPLLLHDHISCEARLPGSRQMPSCKHRLRTGEHWINGDVQSGPRNRTALSASEPALSQPEHIIAPCLQALAPHSCDTGALC